MTPVVAMLKKLIKDSKIEFNNLTKTFDYKEALTRINKEDLYFLAGVKDISKRNLDKDVIEKNYFVIDLDIREKQKDIQDGEIKELALYIKEVLSNSNLFNQWSYIIFSGNGIHIYYIGDFLDISVENYAYGVEKIYKDFFELFDKEEIYQPDPACKNIGRIMRLPGSLNFKRKKYGLEPVKCEILYIQDIKSELIGKLSEYAEFHKKEIEVEKSKKRLEYETKSFKKTLNQVNLFDAICEIDLCSIVCRDYGIDIGKDGKHFNGQKEGYEGMIYYDDINVIWHGGSHYLSRGEQGKTYNTFTYIRDKNKFSDKETFEYFISNYPSIADLNKKNIDEYKQGKQLPKTIIKAELNIEDYDVDLTKIVPYTYGTKHIDNRFGRYEGGKLNVILGESGHGKTEYTFWQAEMNHKMGNNLVYLNLEMSNKDLFVRKARNVAGITKEQWNDKIITDKQKADFHKEFERLKNLDYVISGKFNLSGIIEKLRELSKQGVYLFYIDNLGYIEKEDKKQTEQDFVSEVTREMKQLCKEIGVTINLLHHFVKGSDKDRNKPRGLGSIRGSGKIENDADNIIMIYRETAENNTYTNISNLILLKDRDWGSKVMCGLEYYMGGYRDFIDNFNTNYG